MPTNLKRHAAIAAKRAETSDTLIFPLSSEEPVKRFDGDEILSHADGDVDLSWLNSGNAPLIDTHNTFGMASQIGVVVRAWLENLRLYVEVRFSQKPHAQEVMRDILDGIVRNVSVGYSFQKAKVTAMDDGSYVVRNWMPTEASIVPVPADMTVGVGRSNMEHRMPDTPKMPDPAQLEAERAEALTNSLNEIRSLARTHNIGAIAESFIDSEIRSGAVPSIEVFRGIARSEIPEGTPLRNEDIGLAPQETRRFSLLKLARAMADGATSRDEEAAAFEIDACRAAAETAEGPSRGMYRLPTDLLRSWGDFEFDGVRSSSLRGQRAAMDTAGNPNVQDVDHLSGRFIDNLRNASSILRAGVTVLDGLSGDVDIPAGNANVQAAWLAAEDDDVAESNPTFRKVQLSIKDLGAYTDMTRRMLMQSTIAIENYVRNQLVTAVVEAIDAAGLYGTGLTGIPLGVANTSGIGAVAFTTPGAPSREEVINLRTEVASTNRGRGITYIGNSVMVGSLLNTRTDPGSGMFIMNDSADRLIGNPFIESNQVVDGDLFGGAWSDAFLGMWGSLELDRSTEAKFLSGGLRLRVIQSVDYAVGRVGSFALGQ